MKKLVPVLFVLIACLGATEGCRQNNPGPSAGGRGGKATLTVTPEHHGQFVDSCTIYIKYATSDAPANGIYDDSARCILADTTPVATFTQLTAGSYYIYGAGYHAGYVPPNVKGGLPVTISKEDTVNIYLPTAN
jgi:hypothetical protein